MPVVLAPAAADDLEEIVDYIRADNPAAAARFVAALRERCARLDDAPGEVAYALSCGPV